MTAADHQESVGMMKERAAGDQRGQSLARIDEVRIDLVRCRLRPHAEQAVLAVEHDLAAGRDVVGHHGRQPDAEVDVPAVVDVLGGAPSHLRTGKRGHLRPPQTITRRWTNIPGVCTDSGSMSPSSTSSLAWTTVSSAAIAITGLKLRADLRYVRLPQRSARCARSSATSPRSGFSNT